MNNDKLKEYVVIVNGGSGVVFQPADEKLPNLILDEYVFAQWNAFLELGNL